ncbi:YfiT family bacillithiol transferase [Paenibacillus harenae]|uniref:YfiT family bacillithiol transferase n=1 Tax=Paenibacillus harenae TaxID=306543 RepID=UPI00278F4E5C|nr:putative metal-dependent hydrolase [Paenibacillus harenae]MDQ0060845.1 putative kinase/uncharacterized damage-inducible protein DinB [Paenibacillus harenae]
MEESAVLHEFNSRKRKGTPLVVMMCGVAGSGKTTFAQKLEKSGFVRLSIDEHIWATKGRYGIDYPIEMYEQLKLESEQKLRNQMVSLIKEKQRVVVDFSFWQRQRRNEYKKLIEVAGGEWELVYLKVPPDELRERLRIRSERFDANAAFTITEQLLTSFLNGFETPSGEGEIVIEQMPPNRLRYPIGKFEPVVDVAAEIRAGFVEQIPDIVVSLKRLTASLTPEQLDRPYREGGWSIKQIVHHMADNDMNAYLRFKRALTEDEPLGNSYREDLFAELSDYKDVPVENSIALLEILHKRFRVLLQGMNEEDFHRRLATQALGSITLDIALQRFVWHNRHHTAQIAAATKLS